MHITAFVVIALTAGLPAAASAQGPADDPRWAPWLGCWEMVRENVREGAAALPDGQPPAELPPPLVVRPAPRVCVMGKGLNAVTLTTTLDGQAPLVQTLVADGSEQPLDGPSCQGTQRLDWSARGTRLYSQAELTCGEEVRRVWGLSLIDRDGTWIDIRAVRIGSRETTRVGKFRRVADESAAPGDAHSSYTLEDVKEGIARVSPRVIEVALVETKASFRLSSRQLIDVADAHVPAHVIDLIVALSYPEQFVVDQPFRREVSRFSSTDPFFVSPSVYLAGFGIYDDLGFLLFYWSPMSYSSLGLYGSQYFFGSDGPYGPSGVPVHPPGTGRVINGVGYTQVRPRDTGNTSGSPTTSSTSSSSGGSSGSGGGSVSSAGFSSGGAGDSGRTAVPR
jgi:uncharacterized membrane protein YgcG